MKSLLDGKVILHAGDCLDVLKVMADASVDSVVTDPPYGLSFMGKWWDREDTIAFKAEFWAEVLRVLKPGGHCVAFSGSRTYHRMVCAIEDAGFEIRDQLQWLYGSGFPKSHDVSKGIDKAAGAEREVVGLNPTFRKMQEDASAYNLKRNENLTVPSTGDAIRWQGWGTALKPAHEPIVLARKPLQGTVVANVLAHGVGALNIDGCRVMAEGGDEPLRWAHGRGMGFHGAEDRGPCKAETSPGRWPANLLHDGSDEVVGAFPETGASAPNSKPAAAYEPNGKNAVYGAGMGGGFHPGFSDASGSAARFFYSAKADADDRIGSKHPTVKPVDLMQWLCRLITPPGGLVLDPFAGTGTTGEAAFREGFRAVLIEREAEYQADIAKRMGLVLSGPDERKRARTKLESVDALPLFGALE